jgi:hypothetical protein
MDRPPSQLAAIAATVAFARVPVACGDDDVKDAQNKATDAANSVKTEAQDLKKSVDSKHDRQARVDELQKEAKKLKSEGSDRADDVRRELEKAREDLSR